MMLIIGKKKSPLKDRISIILYIDDFEVRNPLGTSRKKHSHSCVLCTGKSSSTVTINTGIYLFSYSV